MTFGRRGRFGTACGMFVGVLGLAYVAVNGTGSVSEVFHHVFSGPPRATVGSQQDAATRGNAPLDIPTRLPGVRTPPVEAAHATRIPDDTPILGLSIGGQDRAYACAALASPLSHVVNDVVGGQAVTVTYCDRNAAARVLTDRQRGEPLDISFHAMIRDHMQIEISGRVFEQSAPDVPFSDLEFTRTTWGAWKQDHPASDVYAVIPVFADVRFSIPGIREPETQSAGEVRLRDRTRVIGVTTSAATRAYVEQALRLPGTHVINDLFGDDAITVTYCDRCDCVRVLTRPHAGGPLDVKVGGFLNSRLALEIDGQTFSQDAAGLPLQEQPFTRTTWGEWKSRHPETDVYVGNYSESAASGLGD